MGELARRSNVPVATLKFYLREGLIVPARKSGATMSWYDATTLDRIRVIKELQDRQFLPLDVIRETLERDARADSDQAVVAAIAGVLAKHGTQRTRTRDELLERGVRPKELDWLGRVGLAVPGADGLYRDDDLALLATLGAARKAGLVEEMLPFQILADYMRTLHQLVAIELSLFRAGVIKRANSSDLEQLTTAATELSERLVVLIRRKLLVPTLRRLIEEETREKTTGADTAGRMRRVRKRRAAKPKSRRRH